jgi:hypothetical protein
VTDVAKPCLRCAYLDIVAPRPLPVERRRLFESGRLVECRWVGVLRGLRGVRVLSTQLPVCYEAEGFRIHGRIDALVQHGGGRLVVHEVKSVGSLRYVVEPVAGHVGQLQFYLNVLGVEGGRLDYVERSILSLGVGEGLDVCFPVERDGEVFGGLLERAGRLYRCLVEGGAPLGEACWLCKRCLHRDACTD